jgi:phage gp29-like protein
MAFKHDLNTVLFDKWGNPITAVERSPQNAPELSSDRTIVAKIISEFQDRNRAEIQKWQQALRMAKLADDPRAFSLQDLYDNLESDGHFISARELRKSATLCADFSVINRQTGDIDPEATELFREEWFYNFRSDVLDSIFKGFTLLELIDPARLTFSVVPRRNVQAKFGRVFFEVAGNSFIDFNSPLYANQVIKVGKTDNLGLLADLCGLLIWKRNAQQSWAEYTEKYGQPLITATTDKVNKKDIDDLNDTLMALGEAARAVLPEGTTIKIEQFTGGDSYNVYDKQIERINTEISKPLVGGTMLTDEGSSRSQSEVHERNLDEKIAARDKLTLEYITNGQLIPIMQRWGHKISPETHKFRHDASFELTLKEHWEVINSALDQYDIPDEWISKTFNFPINGRKKSAAAPVTGKQIEARKTGSGFSANFR